MLIEREQVIINTLQFKQDIYYNKDKKSLKSLITIKTRYHYFQNKIHSHITMMTIYIIYNKM